jgi:aldehyde:ferredoxin oxidoreductase
MGFLGRILNVDLSDRRVSMEEADEATAHLLLGGRGNNALRLVREVPAGTDPLGPDNLLLLTAGLLTGTEAPSSSRLHVGARSPLTGLLGSSSVGAHFGAEIRSAGVQAIAIRGQADRPVYISIRGDRVEIVDAEELWGQDAWETQDALRARSGDDKARVMAIGPGGESMVRYGCIMTERGHAAGRTGMGAVMGSKRLKAIVARGDGRQERAGDPAVQEAVRRYALRIREAERYPIYARYSNTGFVSWADETGILATRNYRENRFAGASRIDGEQIIRYVTRPSSCYRCPVHCKAELEIPNGPYAGTVGERPDIEPLVALGSKCGLDDPEAVLYLYNLCGKLGIDVISAASTLAFAMELREERLISKADTNGIDLVWGNAVAMESMLLKIARREGFGAILAEGVARAAVAIGGDAGRYALHAKGLELTAYDPRGAMGTALGYAVSSRGGDFNSAYTLPEYRWDAEEGRRQFGTAESVNQHSPESKGPLLRRTMSVSAVMDALGICKVAALNVVDDFSLRAEAELATAISGIPLCADDLLTVGERILNLERLFNLQQGARPADDRLPERFRLEGLSAEPNRGATVDVAPMVRQYYATMGWDAEGRPTAETLQRLSLSEILSS